MAEIVTIKKIKKDATIDRSDVDSLTYEINNDKLLVFPIDGIYGLLMKYNRNNLTRMRKIFCNDCNPDYFFITSAFSIIEQIADVNKQQYDFLHRIWPDEINVVLDGNESNGFNKKVEIRIPKYQFLIDILDGVNEPVIFMPIISKKGKKVYRKKDILTLYEDKADLIVYFSDWNRLHQDPTVIDIRLDKLDVINSGRVSIEEIQSLYFLDSPFED